MTLHTDRLNIRDILINDIDHIHELHSLVETDEFNTLGIPDNVDISKQLIAEWMEASQKEIRTSYTFCIENNGSGKFIGLIALNVGKPSFKVAEVWYKIHVNYWGNGFATEALIKLLDFGFNQLKLHRIEAGCAVGNIASIKVLEKVGMIKEGMKRKSLPIRGEWIDSYSFAILDQDYFILD